MKTITYTLRLDDKQMISELNKLENEIKRLNEIQKKYNKNNKTASETSTKRALKIKDLKRQVNDLTKSIKKEDAAQKKENKTTVNAIKADRTYFKNLEKLNRQKQKAIALSEKQARANAKGSSSTKKWSSALGSHAFKFNFLANAVAGATMAVGMYAAMLVKNAIKTVMDFSKQQSKLASIIGTTKEGIKDLTDESIRLGSETKYTGTEITKLQVEFAKFGLSKEEIKAVTEATTNLATALDVELADSAKLVASTMKAFQLEAGNANHIAEVLGISTTKTALDFEKLSDALPYVSTGANAMNISLEDTTAMLGMLVDRGLKASTAGTSLRKVFVELTRKGISFKDAMAQINNSTDKNKTAIELFGVKAKDAGLILASTGVDTKNLTKELKNLNGELEEMADTQLDNLSGDITLLGSAWEKLILSIENGDGIISKFARFVVNYVTKAINTITSDTKEWWQVVVELGQKFLALGQIVAEVGAIFGQDWTVEFGTETNETIKKINKLNKAMKSASYTAEDLQKQIKNNRAAMKEIDLTTKEGVALYKAYGRSIYVAKDAIKNIAIIQDRQAKKEKINNINSIEYLKIWLNNQDEVVAGYAKARIEWLKEVENEEKEAANKELIAHQKAIENQKKHDAERIAAAKKHGAELNQIHKDRLTAKEIMEQAASDMTLDVLEAGQEEIKVIRNNDLIDELNNIEIKRQAKEKAYLEEIEAEKNKQEMLKALREEGFQAAIDIGNALVENVQIGYDNELNALNQKHDNELISDEEFEKRVYAIKKKQFELDKKTKISNIWVDAASAVMNVWSKWAANPVVASLLSAMPVALAGVQTANVNKQQFYGKDGGVIKGNSHLNGGVNVNMEDGEFLNSKASYTKYKPLINELNTSANAGRDANIIDYNKLASVLQSKKVYVVSSEMTEKQNNDILITDKAKF